MSYAVGSHICFSDQHEDLVDKTKHKLTLVGTSFKFWTTPNGLQMAVKIPIVYS